MRLDVRNRQAPLIWQVQAALNDELQARGIDAPAFDAGEALWHYLHRHKLEMWSRQNQLLSPLFVFDQFEEVFTLGLENAAAIAALRIDLADLIENRIPAALTHAAREDERLGAGLSLDTQRYKVLLSFREDFLPAVEGWKHDLPSLQRNRLRLLPMSGEQAFEAVHTTASYLVDGALARRIVHFVAAAQDEGAGRTEAGADGRELEVEPALLSVVCRGLNDKRKAQGSSKFDDALLSGSGQTIISDYYRDAVRDVPETVRRFIENELITERGFRKTCDLDDARSVHGVSDRDLRLLVDRRLLRIEPWRGTERIELTHDLLTRVVREHRDRQRDRRKLQRNRRRTAVLAFAGIWLLALVVVFGWLLIQARRQKILTSLALREEQAALVQVKATSAAAQIDRDKALTAQHTAEQQTQRADQQAAAAELAKTQGEQEAQIAVSDQLALASLKTLGQDAGIIFALQATSVSHTANKTILPEVEEALRHAAPPLPIKLIQPGHTSPVIEVAFSPDGTRIASAGAIDGVRIWSASSGTELLTMPAECQLEPGIVFSRDGKTIACAGDGGASVWDAATGRRLIVVENRKKSRRTSGSTVATFALSTDGALLAILRHGESSDGAELWDISSRTSRLLKNAAAVSRVAFGPDGRRIATSSGHCVKVWDTSNGMELVTLNHTEIIEDLAFYVQGARPVVSVAGGNAVSTWDATSGQALLAFTAAAPVSRIAFTSDGSRLAMAGGARISIRDVASSKELWSVAHAGPAIARLLFTPTGDRLVAVSGHIGASPDVKVPTEVKVWDAGSGKPVEDLPGRGVFSFSPDGKRIAVEQGHAIGVEDAFSSRRNPLWIAGRNEALRAGAFSGDSKFLATAGEAGDNWGVVIWDLASRRPLRTLAPVRARAVAWSRDQKLLSTVSYEDEPKVWDVDSGRLLSTLSRGRQPVLGLAFSPDHRIGATVSHDGSAQLWDLRASDSSEIHLPYPVPAMPPGYSVAYSSDGRYLAVGGGKVTVADASSGKVLRILDSGNQPSRALTFSPDDKRLALVDNQKFGIWDWSTGATVLKVLAGSLPGSGVDGTWTIAFSPDGSWLAGPGPDQTVRVWDAASGKELQSLFGAGRPIIAVQFSREGNQLYAVSDDGWIYRHLLRIDDLIADARARIRTPLTLAQCRQYLHADSCPPWALALGQLAQGNELAASGDIDGAIASFRKASDIDAGSRFDPQSQIDKLASGSLPVRVSWALHQGNWNAAIAAYSDAQRLDPQLDVPADSWSVICWTGVIRGQSVQVMPACEKAVARDPESLNARDGRGAARALAGNLSGAIEDLEFSLSHSAKNARNSDRQQWVAALRAGKNRFTPAEIQSLAAR